MQCPVCGAQMTKNGPHKFAGELFVASDSGTVEYEDEAHDYTCTNGHNIYLGENAEKDAHHDEECH
jgi:hypothetical protein